MAASWKARVIIMKNSHTLAVKGLLNKNSKIFALVMLSISFLLLILSLSFKQGIDNFVTGTILNNIDARRLMVHTEETPYEFEEAIQIVGKMDHVLQAYSHEKAYSSGVLTQKFNGYDGMISLAGAASNTLPDVTEGRAFSDIERKAIIIPEKFIPDSNANAQLKNKSDYIDGKELIGETLTLGYYVDTYDENLNVISSEPRECSFTVVGVYDSQHVFKNNNTCYIAYDDVYQLTKDQDGNIYDYALFNYLFHVIVDDYTNLQLVQSEIESLGLKADIAFTFTTDFAYAISLAVAIVSVIMLVVSLVIILVSMVKNILRNIKYIGLLKTIGYTNRDINTIIIKQYAWLSLIALFISLLLSLVLTHVIAQILLQGEIAMGLFNIGTLIAVLVAIIIPLLVALIMQAVLRKISPIEAMRIE